MQEAMNLGELPLDCIVTIISHTTPLDACRLASVCHSFALAVRSGAVWAGLLPSDHAAICKKSGESRICNNKKEILGLLLKGIYLEGRRQRYSLLRRSGGLCRILSVSAMNIAWGDDCRFWKWEPSRSSCFSKVAHLLAVCWFEVSGKWTCSLIPGAYSIAWRLKIANPRGGIVHFLSWKKPLQFCFVTSNGVLIEKQLDLAQIPVNGFESWFEFEIGQMVVGGQRLEAQQLDLDFYIKELDCSFWKGGLYLDCLILRPAFCEENVLINEPVRLSEKVRGRPGVF
ncbi:hypothetical protein O6H91_06G122800 [Diphasiastrum complanatum]|uniref:Uncharacterized protein n=2 Tax=Diphasiastrum complanatum TaxID=34168 RepID=A0ACC2DIM9_DIPCM|nr:hypothetical protein O6H91_06G122100 [Diphasiastrum complanatum]KAJ7554020.1 hypothetical protein O6H91_06G122800 [Diphasiastrum complanatum]